MAYISRVINIEKAFLVPQVNKCLNLTKFFESVIEQLSRDKPIFAAGKFSILACHGTKKFGKIFRD